ncbi:glycosyl transferase family 41-domain-containing protein [Usnea florida]
MPPRTLYTPTSEASEHMLRRKTPNGTLAAGYDGSSVEWTKRLHATKHLLLPTSNTSSQTTYPQRQTEGHRARSSPQTGHSFDLGPGEQCANHSKSNAPSNTTVHGARSSDEIKADARWRPNNVSSTGLDSVLNQSYSHHFHYSSAESQHIPTVLQPMWPPYLSPTYLQGLGPYGQYAPDGAFDPYHTSLVRDPRFQHQHSELTVDLSTPQPLVVNHQGQWLQAHSDPQHDQPADHSVLFASTLDERTHELLASPHQVHDSMNNASSVFSNRVTATAQQQYGNSLAYRHKPSVWKDQSARTLNRVYSYPGSTDSEFGTPSLPSHHNPVVSDSNTHFREKVLMWAHRIYGGLLAAIEQTRRNALNEQHTPGLQYQASCYPHPPRRPYPSWSNSYGRNHRTCDPDIATQVSLKDVNNVLNQPFTPIQTGNRSPISHISASQPSSANCTSQPSSQTRQRWHLRDGGARSSSLGSHSSYVPSHLSPDIHATSPSAAAVYAMEMLNRLCRESALEWIDGMLLTGCLSYGLGDYNKAMKWYLKVLQRDPNNVEAMSNLAATLLALNRRDDAEQYWLRSVKLRPSYFEAIEHLIGLLHECHRGNEAVKVIEYVEHALRIKYERNLTHYQRESVTGGGSSADKSFQDSSDLEPVNGFGSSGYAISPSDNGRMLALVHGKGNMLYQLGDNAAAAKAFEDAILIGAGGRHLGIRGLIKQILVVYSEQLHLGNGSPYGTFGVDEPILLPPEIALETSRLVFPKQGRLPGLEAVPDGFGYKAAVSIISNSLLSLAKIYQDGMSSSGAAASAPRATSGVQEILALYYLSLSLQPSPSTANNVGILLAGVQQSARSKSTLNPTNSQASSVPGVTPGSGIALALAYYDYGLKLDSHHAHLYTNLGSLFKDIGQLNAAIKMYEKAVECDGNFDIALANLANAVKDQGKVSDAIKYYRRAVTSNPDFAEAVCGLANALNSVCNWRGRGGINRSTNNRDRWHVDECGDLLDSKNASIPSSGWIERVVAIVEKQLHDGEGWGKGVLLSIGIDKVLQRLSLEGEGHRRRDLRSTLERWAGSQWEGAKVVRLIERATRDLVRHIYRSQYIEKRSIPSSRRTRPQLPAALAIPSAPTVLPFHTFTCPLSAKQIRKISQRNGLRVSCSTLRAPWLSAHVYDPPAPPNPNLNVGYISSDFNNHPLAHLMQSVFGFHNKTHVKAFCYATTASDGSVHRQQIQREAPVFYDASSWPVDRVVNQIVADGIHILINLNGYTRGARNEVFAARPAPIQMSFMGFAGTLGAEWCDYLLADKIAVPPQTLRPWRGNVDLADQTQDGNNEDDHDDWVYGENIIFTRDTFFCCDHRQSAPDAQEPQLSWPEEQRRRWNMRKDLFPNLPDDAVIFGNFNQLYKIDPTTFRTWLRILSRTPKAVLWLLRFPDLGEENLRQTALRWVGAEVASRIIFTDVAPKHQHISRARICDLFLDTPECNAHTTAADVLWSGTPLLTLPRYEYKMCSRMAASILRGALPKDAEGDRAAGDLIADSDEAYEEQGVELGSDLMYPMEESTKGMGKGRLMELRKLLYESRRTSSLFDTRRWVRDLESAYSEAWRRWVAGEGGDIWL